MLRRAIMAAAAGGGGGGGSDPDFASVSALLHFDGADGSTSFTDVIGNSWTGYGAAQLDTAQAKFGSTSFLSQQFESTRIYTAPSTRFGMGSGAFTVEGWYRPGAFGEVQVLYDCRESGTEGFSILARSNIYEGLCYYTNAGNLAGSAVTFTDAVWSHWAVVREADGTTVRGYVGGVQRFTATDSRTMAASSSVGMFGNFVGSQSISGHVDEVRVTKGVCRYPGGTSFTPPTAAFPDSL